MALMEKATKAIRRSGTKLRGLSSRHGPLNVIIGQLGDQRVAHKGFISTQATSLDDIVHWSKDFDSKPISDTVPYISELFLLWTEVQRELSERHREFKTMFELILEGERHVDQSRELYNHRENSEMKYRKDLEKGTERGGEEMKVMQERVTQAVKSKELAYLEVAERMKENEAVKLIRFREGLRKMSEGYIVYGEKCQAIFRSCYDVATTLPDPKDKKIQNMMYAGNRKAHGYVQRAKQQVLSGCSTDPPPEDHIYLPPCGTVEEEGACALPPHNEKATAKEKEADASASSSGCASPSMNDPPPSYSSVFGGEASGAIPKPDGNAPIKETYPTHMNPRMGFLEPRAAAIPEESNVDGRLSNSEQRSSMYPPLGRVSERTGSFDESEYERMNLGNNYRQHDKSKKLLKSFSLAGSAISDMLRLNTNNSNISKKRRQTSFNNAYNKMDFHGPPMGSSDGGGFGVRADDMTRVRKPPKVEDDPVRRQKSAALSAKFSCREELSPPIPTNRSCKRGIETNGSEEEKINGINDTASQSSGSKSLPDSSKSHKSVSAANSQCTSSVNLNNDLNHTTDDNNEDQRDLINFNISIHKDYDKKSPLINLVSEESNASNNNVALGNLTTNNVALGTLTTNNVALGNLRTNDMPGNGNLPAYSSGSNGLFDGNLAQVAQPRSRSTNPFLDSDSEGSQKSKSNNT